jgi:hypothetical protein
MTAENNSELGITKLCDSFERNETRRVGGTNTGPTMLHRLVGKGELSKVVANHFRLDLNLVEGLAIVNSDDTSNHLRNNDHVAEMGPHRLWLLTNRCIFFLFKGRSENEETSNYN